MLIEKLSTHELAALSAYKKLYSGARNGCEITHYLREWDNTKQQLFHILNDQFILSKPITYKKSGGELGNEIWNTLLSTPLGQQLRNKITEISYAVHTYKLNWLMEDVVLGDNEYPYDSFSISCPSGKTIQVQKKCKPMRVLAKLAQEFQFEEMFEQFRLVHSQILNQKALNGELCLSIHPLDYMTMSDNNCDWTSCMSWKSVGCYRAGTVEMMNSAYVVVAYLKSASNDLYFDDYSWNSKKWRVLLIVDPQNKFVCSIKDYPYHNAMLCDEAVSWLSSLVMQYNPDLKFNSEIIHTSDPYNCERIRIDFCTRAMYNDFGCTTHSFMLTEDYSSNDDKVVDYSGCFICAACGDYTCANEEEGDEEFLVCPHCDGRDRREECAICGCREHQDYIRWVDDEPLCEYCFDNETVYDTLDDEYHLKSNVDCKRTIYIAPEALMQKSNRPHYLIRGNNVFEALGRITLTREWDDYSQFYLDRYTNFGDQDPNECVVTINNKLFMSSKYITDYLVRYSGEFWGDTVNEYDTHIMSYVN